MTNRLIPTEIQRFMKNYKVAVPVNTIKDQFMTLEFQIKQKVRDRKDLKWQIRNAKRNANYLKVRKAETKLSALDFQLNTLRNQRNHLFNVVMGKKPHFIEKRTRLFCGIKSQWFEHVTFEKSFVSPHPALCR